VGVVAHVVARAEAELDDPSRQARADPFPERREPRHAARPVHDAGQHVVAVDAHGRAPSLVRGRHRSSRRLAPAVRHGPSAARPRRRRPVWHAGATCADGRRRAGRGTGDQVASSEGTAVEVETVEQLTAAEQAALTGGIELWHTAPVDRIGVPSLRVTDGPAGARGTQFGGERSLLLPCPTAMASTWRTELVGRVGQVLAAEVRRKGAVVLLAPTVNLQRDPRGGRCFECFSEDPQLSAELAVAYVDGVQGAGVGCAVKHLVANDQEQDRMTVSVEVDDRTLRELYLLPFEAAVRRAGAWMVMAAYNRLGGTYCSAHRDQLT